MTENVQSNCSGLCFSLDPSAAKGMNLTSLKYFSKSEPLFQASSARGKRLGRDGAAPKCRPFRATQPICDRPNTRWRPCHWRAAARGDHRGGKARRKWHRKCGCRSAQSLASSCMAKERMTTFPMIKPGPKLLPSKGTAAKVGQRKKWKPLFFWMDYFDRQRNTSKIFVKWPSKGCQPQAKFTLLREYGFVQLPVRWSSIPNIFFPSRSSSLPTWAKTSSCPALDSRLPLPFLFNYTKKAWNRTNTKGGQWMEHWMGASIFGCNAESSFLPLLITAS